MLLPEELEMNTRSINRKVIELLTELSDNKEVSVTRNKHIKVTGVFAGEKHSLMLACSNFLEHPLLPFFLLDPARVTVSRTDIPANK